MSARAWFRPLLLVALVAFVAGGVRAEWLAPDASFRELREHARDAARDTIGHPGDFARLDTLALALHQLGRGADARRLYERVLALNPSDPTALAGLGKMALHAGDLALAESLLTRAVSEEGARADLYALRLRRGQWAEAATMCEERNDLGRQGLLERLAESGGMKVVGEQGEAPFERIWPAPIVRVKLNGTQVLMLVDTGTPGLLLDKSALVARRARPMPGQRLTPWGGTRVAVGQALVQKLEVGGVAFTDVPAGVLSLNKFSIEANPLGEPLAGVIGLDLLRRFDVSFDLTKRRLVLSPLGSAATRTGDRIAFEEWGEADLMVWGTIASGRRMAMKLSTGLPGAAVGAPEVVFEELGLRSGAMARLVKGGGWLQGRAWIATAVPTLALGRVVLDKQQGWSGAMDAGEMWSEGVRRDAVLGAGLLMGRRTTIDWKRRELVVEYD